MGKSRPKKRKTVYTNVESAGSAKWLDNLNDNRRLVLTRLCLVVTVIFAAYLSILYFGHQTVPNSDFTAFFDTGKSILSFELPSSFKRVPGLGVLQVSLSCLMPGRHPGLTAGWVLNSILYVAIGVLLYLVAKRVIGSAAIWLTLLVLINPMMLRWLRHPIAEVTLVFFIVLTFYFLFRPTRWAYVPAMLTTMVRYEGAILILLCFCFDVFASKHWKSRLLAFVRAALAALPLALWMLGMVLTRKPGAGVSSIPYVKNFEITRQMVIGKFANVIWSNGVGSWFILPGDERMQAIQFVSKIVLAAAILLAVIFCLARKHWRMLSLLGFFGLFFLLHSIRTYTMPRYGVPAIWMTVLAAWYGLKSGWDFLVDKKVIPPPVQVILKITVAIAAIIWVGTLFKYLPELVPMSRQSASVPYVTMAAAAVVLLGRLLLGKFGVQKVVTAAAIFAVMLLVTVSNQFQLVRKVGTGSIDREFKYLADWYYENAESGEVLLTTMPHVVNLFLPEEEAKYVRLIQRVPGDTPNEFLQNCIKRGITYIAWDSRIGLTPDNVYYRRWKMERVAFLRVPRDYGPLTFIHQIQNEDYRYRFINIYKLQLPAGNRSASD